MEDTHEVPMVGLVDREEEENPVGSKLVNHLFKFWCMAATLTLGSSLQEFLKEKRHGGGRRWGYFSSKRSRNIRAYWRLTFDSILSLKKEPKRVTLSLVSEGANLREMLHVKRRKLTRASPKGTMRTANVRDT